MSAHPTEGLRREQLGNGVTLMVQRVRTAPAVAIVTYVRAGFLDEPDALSGASHVLEHMIFKGTPTVPSGEFARRTKALGGALNAYTSYDRTVYYVTVPAENAEPALALQADAVRNPSIDADELHRELGVIVQEARRKLDTPSAMVGETLHELLFDRHRIRRWRIGTEEAIAGFTRADIAGYHATRYVPSRTIAVLVGDIDEARGLDLLRKYYGDWSGTEGLLDGGPVEVAPAMLRARRLSGDVTRADIALGWRGLAPLDDNLPALELATAVLSAGRGARLTRLLRDRGVVSDVGASQYGANDVGVFAIGAELDPGRTGEALGIIGGAVRDLTERTVPTDELGRVRTMMQMQFRRVLERYESRAVSLASAEAQGDVTRLDRRESRLLGVSPQDVREIAAALMRPDRAAAVAYFPTESAEPFDADVLERALGAGATRVSVVVPRASADQRVHAGTRTSGRGPLGIVHVAGDAVDVLVAPHGTVAQVTLGVWRPRHDLETAATAGRAALGMRSMLRGTTSHDSDELALAMESLGGTLGSSLGADALGFGTTVMAERANDAARLLADVLWNPRFDASAVEVERELLIEDARAVANDAVRFPVQLMLGEAFGDTGYGAPTLGTPTSLAAVGSDDLASWHEAMLRGARTTIIATGDVDAARLAEQLADIFDRPTAMGASVPRTDPGVGIRAGVRIERRERKQSAFAMLFPGPSRESDDRYAAEVWAAIAGGLGGTLFDALRERRSLAYTVIASSWQRRRTGGLLTYIAMAPERLDEARDAMLDELALFRDAPPSEPDTARATAMLAGQEAIARQTAGALAGAIADAWLLGTGLDELEAPGAAYRDVTPDDVHRVARASLDPAARAEGVLDARPITPE